MADMMIADGVVLIVEDHPLVQITVVEVLEEAGFPAIAAGSADEALGILSSRTDIRALFTDVEMPGSMDGMALVALVRARWPHIKTMITSGGRQPDMSLMPNVAYYQKPYNPRVLIDALMAAPGRPPISPAAQRPSMRMG